MSSCSHLFEAFYYLYSFLSFLLWVMRRDVSYLLLVCLVQLIEGSALLSPDRDGETRNTR
ncbi:hypothetical protein F4802DRAFT_571096 [Xylaria palmicola]|nr:hypothetical protein F4802DRAFT_571096 [Xylaria palmicola]